MTLAQQPVSRHTLRTPANAVTALRILLAPVLVAAIHYYAPAWWVLAFGFLAMITDRIDGMLARRYGTSAVGTFLDPLADKLMVLGAMGALVANGFVWWVPVVLIAAREVGMSYWRSELARKGVSVPARPSAKYKTWTQSFTVALAITPGVVDNYSWLLNVVLWASVAITYVTLAQYLTDSRKPASAR